MKHNHSIYEYSLILCFSDLLSTKSSQSINVQVKSEFDTVL